MEQYQPVAQAEGRIAHAIRGALERACGALPDRAAGPSWQMVAIRVTDALGDPDVADAVALYAASRVARNRRRRFVRRSIAWPRGRGASP
jgi:hypothetical protein